MYLPNKKRPWLPWLAGFLLIAFLVAFFHFLGGILTPFIIAAVLAYILNPLVSKLEAHGIKRGRASMWVMLFALFLLTALLLVIVPMLVQQSQSIIQKLPITSTAPRCRGLTKNSGITSRSTTKPPPTGCAATRKPSKRASSKPCPR